MIKMNINKSHVVAECKGETHALVAESVMAHVTLAENVSKVLKMPIEQAALFIYQQAAQALSQMKEGE